MFGLSVCLSRKVYSVTHWAKIFFNFFSFSKVSSNHGVKRFMIIVCNIFLFLEQYYIAFFVNIEAGYVKTTKTAIFFETKNK